MADENKKGKPQYPDINILRSVIYTLDSLPFPLAAARRGDETMSRIAGCLDALEKFVAEAEAAEAPAAEAAEAPEKEVPDNA